MNVITFARNGFSTVPGISAKMKSEHRVIRLRKGDIAPCRPGLLIRWASCVPFSANVTINQRSAIGIASNKAEARLLMQAEGVPVPKTKVYYGDVESMFEISQMQFPLVARPQKHRAGKDFLLIDETDELYKVRLGWYVSEFYNKTSEYRVHVAHGRVLVVNRKTAPDPELYNQPIWNHALNNFWFEVVRRNLWPVHVMRIAVHATEVLGLDYGAVDVLSDAPDDPRQAVVCEVNTSPTLVDYASSQYAIYFDWLIRTGGQEPHFPMPESTSPNAYSFRNEINHKEDLP